MICMTGFRSFNNSRGKRVLNLLEAGNVRLRQTIVKRNAVTEFAANDGGGYGASCGGIIY